MLPHLSHQQFTPNQNRESKVERIEKLGNLRQQLTLGRNTLQIFYFIDMHTVSHYIETISQDLFITTRMLYKGVFFLELNTQSIRVAIPRSQDKTLSLIHI